MRNRLYLLLVGLLLVILPLPGRAQEVGVHFLSFAQLEDSMRVNPRKILVEIYTTWCSHCRLMESETFAHDGVRHYLGESFYTVRLDAEQNDGIVFGGQSFRFQPHGNGTGIHQLVLALAGKEEPLAYPMLVVLDEQYRIMGRKTGSQPPKGLLGWLQSVFP